MLQKYKWTYEKRGTKFWVQEAKGDQYMPDEYFNSEQDIGYWVYEREGERERV
jgi:hypothetical protein